ncbi:hypothetical protein P7B02_03390 [Caulobacter segnis]|uniref:hypothetical protein n=1 Tax=Caulobacter segnis TaxID=88688 RepID=UPI00240F737C|nr:hypothetical protein [Caulobacter segnis]MDG2520575.1 hypothetical protein [Caulobacter segnis]
MTLFAVIGIPTFWMYSIFDLASGTQPQDGERRWLFILPPTLLGIGQSLSVTSPDGQSALSAIGSFIALGGAFSYLLCLWKSSGALIRADSPDGTINGWQRFSIVLALLYTIIGVWALQGKFRRVAAKSAA